MRIVKRMVALIVITLLLGYAAYALKSPGKIQIATGGVKPVAEMKQLTITYPQETPDGKIEHRTKTLSYEVVTLVPEQGVKVIPPSAVDRLRDFVLYGVVLLYLAYCLFVGGYWIRLTLAEKKGDRRLVKIEKRVDMLVSFGAGVIGGILAGNYSGADAEKQQALASAQAGRQQVEQYELLLKQQAEQFQSLATAIRQSLNSVPPLKAEPSAAASPSQ